MTDEATRIAAERTHDKDHDFIVKLNEAVINNGNIALRAALIINGGAAIAMLSFISTLVTKTEIGRVHDYASITLPLFLFAIGVALAGFAISMAYFTNYSIIASISNRTHDFIFPFVHANNKTKNWNCAAIVFQCTAIFCGLLSLAMFVYGTIRINDAFSQFL